MTVQGTQEIMNRLAILPPTEYGPYYFKRDIRRTIGRVTGREHADRTMKRMTDLGMLVWSQTGRMAKVVQPEPTYRLIAHGVPIISGLCEADAYQVADDYGWDEVVMEEE